MNSARKRIVWQGQKDTPLWLGLLLVLGLAIHPKMSAFPPAEKEIGWPVARLILNPEQGLQVEGVVRTDGKRLALPAARPLFSILVNGQRRQPLPEKAPPLQSELAPDQQGWSLSLGEGLRVQVKLPGPPSPAWTAQLIFHNTGRDTLKLENLVPFGQSADLVHITASGPWALARSKLYLPGRGPVGVILPDNAWELGYAALPLPEKDLAVCALARRGKTTQGRPHRYWTHLYPGGTVRYTLYVEGYQGEWQNGLRLMFQHRYLYDLTEFDNTLYERKDLQWIRHAYVLALQYAWDHEFYDALQGGYRLKEYLEMGRRLFGGWDVYGLWPTWPRLGLDERNQWDHYRDLPGGLPALRQLVDEMHARGTRFFIAYNPWDESTRPEDHLQGMATILGALDADGVVLDTRGASNPEIQAAADQVKPGIIMYSEGMAVPRDMPGIVSGRVHDAIFLPPPLNLNKLIKPEFAIFRVCQLSQGRIHREVAISFFNGYGVEINTFAPGRPTWMEEDYRYLGRAAMILRENSDTFHSRGWTPLVPSRVDSVWVNRWPGPKKTLYTIFSLRPEGVHEPLFAVSPSPDSHFVDLWHHQEVEPDTLNGQVYLPVRVEAFPRAALGTRREGEVSCVARFPRLLTVSLREDSLYFSADRGSTIRLWAGNPSYQNRPKEFSPGEHRVWLYQLFGRYEGKFVLQLLEGNRLLDERVVLLKPGTPRLISRPEPTEPARTPPPGMVEIPAGTFVYQVEYQPHFVPYPDYSRPRQVQMPGFYMDRYPVTNRQFKAFLDATGYVPRDTANFLKHWRNGTYPPGQADYPVVYVSLSDARAYARWAGKRLPTDLELQYAAQGTDGRKWPWGNEFDSSRCNVGSGRPTPVNQFPRGASPFGVEDLVGNVWQLTDNVYDNGSHYFVLIRGGSYFKPSEKWWYVPGGPQPVTRHQMLLMVSDGFDRAATVGFRCVKDKAR